jgi:hypothetical protein
MSTQTTADPKPGLLRSALALRTELASNRRALAGLIAIVTLVAVYGLLLFSDAIAARRDAYRQQVALLHRSSAMGQETEWTARAKESAGVLDALEDRLWNFENEGVALANMQDWITTTARDAKLDKVQVRIEMTHPKGLRPDILQMTANLTAVQTEPALRTFLERVSRERHLVLIEQMRAQTRPASLLQMTIVSYAKLPRAAKAASK